MKAATPAMQPELHDAITRYVEEMLGAEGLLYASKIVANCKMLAVNHPSADVDALVMAAYLRDISTGVYGKQDHHRHSAEMAVGFLSDWDIHATTLARVRAAILVHSFVASSAERERVPLEGQLLYDADKIGRLGGLAIVTALIELGAKYPERTFSDETLATVLHHIEERYVELFQSLYTTTAKDLCREKFGRTLAFLDGVLEQLTGSSEV
jgi:HD superfamily phosphodiesterase